MVDTNESYVGAISCLRALWLVEFLGEDTISHYGSLGGEVADKFAQMSVDAKTGRLLREQGYKLVTYNNKGYNLDSDCYAPDKYLIKEEGYPDAHGGFTTYYLVGPEVNEAVENG